MYDQLEVVLAFLLLVLLVISAVIDWIDIKIKYFYLHLLGVACYLIGGVLVLTIFLNHLTLSVR